MANWQKGWRPPKQRAVPADAQSYVIWGYPTPNAMMTMTIVDAESGEELGQVIELGDNAYMALNDPEEQIEETPWIAIHRMRQFKVIGSDWDTRERVWIERVAGEGNDARIRIIYAHL